MCLSRVVARVIEIARLTLAAEGWARDIKLKDSFCAPGPPPRRAQGSAWSKRRAARSAIG